MKRYSLIVLLVGLFIAPGLIASFLYKRPDLLQRFFPTQTNKGDLLTPPIKSIELGTDKKWHLILWQPSECDVTCTSEIERLARIRLALGRHLYDVDQWVILNQNTPDLAPIYQKTLSNQAIQFKKLSSQPDEVSFAKQLGDTPYIYIANPNHYLILRYTINDKSDAIFHDLKKLIQ